MLPVCLKCIEKPEYMKKSRYSDLSEFKEVLSELISADCWALVIDAEIIFNNYPEHQGKLQTIKNDMVRKFLYENPMEIVHLANVYIDIFMHGTNTKVLKILVSPGLYNFVYYEK